MPRRINFEAVAVPYRRGNTDYIETSVGRRAIRTSGADGSWKLSNLGKRFFKSNALPEVVLRIPCVFLTTKKNGARTAHPALPAWPTRPRPSPGPGGSRR